MNHRSIQHKPDYEALRSFCEKLSSISTEVLDKFLLHYADAKNGLDREFHQQLIPFRHVEDSMPASWKNLIEAQYIGHRIFKKDGLIRKYLNHAEIKRLPLEAQNFLKQQSEEAWRFSFSAIVANPAKDFYEMEDLFNGASFLLYSKSVGLELATRPVLSWFNLVGFNGACWQTFGPVIGFQSFDEDDLFFYATEYNHLIDSVEGLTVSLENNPVPFMMLATGTNFPQVQSGGFEVVHVSSMNEFTDFDISQLNKNFKTEYAEGVLKLTHKKWSEPPHFAEAYLDENTRTLLLSGQTDHGYMEMQRLLAENHLEISKEPEIRFHLPLLNVIEEVFRKEVVLNPYEKLFKEKTSPASDAMMEKLNKLIALALPQMNAAEEPDIEKLAMQTGVDASTAKQLMKQVMARVKKMKEGQKGSAGNRKKN